MAYSDTFDHSMPLGRSCFRHTRRHERQGLSPLVPSNLPGLATTCPIVVSGGSAIVTEPMQLAALVNPIENAIPAGVHSSVLGPVNLRVQEDCSGAREPVATVLVSVMSVELQSSGTVERINRTVLVDIKPTEPAPSPACDGRSSPVVCPGIGASGVTEVFVPAQPFGGVHTVHDSIRTDRTDLVPPGTSNASRIFDAPPIDSILDPEVSVPVQDSRRPIYGV